MHQKQPPAKVATCAFSGISVFEVSIEVSMVEGLDRQLESRRIVVSRVSSLFML